MVGGTDALCTVIRFIVEVTKRECTRRETIFVSTCLARDHAALKVGIFFDVDIKAFASCKEACLIACTAIVGVDISFTKGTSDVGHGKFAVGIFRTRRNKFICGFIKEVDVPRDTKACRVVVFLVGLFLLQGLDVQTPTDLCRDLLTLCLAPDDVHVLARGEGKVVLSRNESRGVGSNRFFAIPIGFVCTDADIRQSRRGKGCTDACRAEFVLGCGDACILARF